MAPTHAMTRSRRWLILGLALGAALALRLLPLPHESLDLDEVFTWRVVSQGWGAGTALVVHDFMHPPLGYWLIKFGTLWAGFSPLALRFVPILFGLAVIVLTWRAGVELLGDERAGLLAALLVAVSDVQTFWGQQARAYSMYCAFALLLALAVHRAAARPERTGRWADIAVIATLLVYSHYLGWLFVGAAGIVLLVTTPPRIWLRYAAACAVVALVFAAWLWVVVPAYRANPVPRIGWQVVPRTAESLWLVARFAGVLPFRHAAPLALAVLAGCGVAAVAAWTRLRRSKRDRGVGVALVGGLAVIPLLIAWIGTLPPFDHSSFEERYLLPAQPFLLLGMAWGVLQLPIGRYGRAAFGAGLIALQLVPTLAASRYPRRVPLASVYAAFSGQRAPGERLYVAPPAVWSLYFPANYYLRPDSARLLGPPGLDPEALWLRSLRAEGSQPFDLPAALPDSLWMVLRPDNPRERSTLEALRTDGWQQVRHEEFPRTPADAAPVTLVHLIRVPGTGGRSSRPAAAGPAARTPAP